MLLDNIHFFSMSQKNKMNVELYIAAIFLDSCGASVQWKEGQQVSVGVGS